MKYRKQSETVPPDSSPWQWSWQALWTLRFTTGRLSNGGVLVPVRTELLWRGRNRIRNTLFHYIYIHIYLYHNTLSVGYLWCFIEPAGWDWDSEFEAEPYLLIRMQRWYKGTHVFCFPSKTLFFSSKVSLEATRCVFQNCIWACRMMIGTTWNNWVANFIAENVLQLIWIYPLVI